MKDRKSTKTYADSNNPLYKLIKGNIDNPYFLEVLYYYIRLALIQKGFNLYDVSYFNISGKYLGYDIKVVLNRFYNNVLKSLSLALSLRAFIINNNYFKFAFNDELLFYSINSNFLNWNCHRVIMECMGDDDFSSIYKMIICYLDEKKIPDDFIDDFDDRTIQPEYHHHEEFCKILAGRDDYNGKTVIKNNQYLYSDIDAFVVSDVVEYVGNTAFAYCENLKQIEFEGKVIFGHFPIIECKNLQRIIVPVELLDYYKAELPYYKDIICDHEHNNDVKEMEDVPQEERTEKVEDFYDLEIEHVYLDTTSADPYVETYVEQDESGNTIDFSIIKHVFDKKATSYKYFWFLAILDIFYNMRQITIPYKNIVAKMAAYAWSYVFDMKMDFGSVDQMKKYLCEVKEVAYIGNNAKEGFIEETILEYYDRSDIKKILSPLLKNVPYRFLSPWIPFTTQEEVIQKSYDYKKYHGVYGIYDEGIVLNAEWLDYFRENYNQLREFVIKELKKAYSARE